MTTTVSSTTTTNSTTGTTTSTGSSLQTSSNGTLQITGLASGLNTNQIVSELMAIKAQPVTALQSQVTGLQAKDTQLTSIQTALQTVQNDVLNLEDPTLFQTTQSVTSSDAASVGASTVGSSGAGVGAYQVSVTALATSAQRTFAFTSPSADDAITIDGHTTTIPAGESISAFVKSINSDSQATVYAAATSSGSVVFSDRTTGNTGANYIQVADPGGALVQDTSKAKQGQDAAFTVDGTSYTSSSNTSSDGIPGVTLSLGAITASPVTVNVAAPAPNATTVASAISQFVTDYNAAITAVQTQISTAPSSSDPTVGTLYEDPDLQGLLSTMRSTMYTSGAGLPSGLASMLDLGVSTGASTGSGSISASSLAGDLTFNATTLQQQLTANPQGVQSVLIAWAHNMGTQLSNEAGIGGNIATRLSTDTSQENLLNTQITGMQDALAQEQNTLTQQYADLEAALSSNQSQSSWLTGQIASLPGA